MTLFLDSHIHNTVTQHKANTNKFNYMFGRAPKAN
jgi:hypothetical protein